MAKYLDETGLRTVWSKTKEKINEAVSTKQDKLTAGNNITITADGTISAADGTTAYVENDEILVLEEGTASGGSSGSGIEIIDISGLDYIPEEYRDFDKLKTCYLEDEGLIYHLSYGSSYFECLDELVYHYIMIEDNFFISREYECVIAREENISEINEKLNAKQDKLTAGDNITITDNVISATATGSGSGIEEVSQLPEATEEEYDKHKLYFYNNSIYYISTDVSDEIVSIGDVNSLPIGVNGPTAAAVGANIYIFGGYNYEVNGQIDTIFKFNTLTNTVTTLQETLPEPCEELSSVSIGTNIYIIGYENNILKFDTISETLTTLSSVLPSSGRIGYGNTCSIAVEYNIYILRANSSEIVKFNTLTNSATVLDGALPYSNDMTSSAAAIGTDIYIVGDMYSNIIKLDTTTETLTILSTTLPTERNRGCAEAVGNNIYIMGGYDDVNGALDEILKFNVTDQTLTSLEDYYLTDYIHNHCSVVVGSNIYIIGGESGGIFRRDIMKIDLTSYVCKQISDSGQSSDDNQSFNVIVNDDDTIDLIIM